MEVWFYFYCWKSKTTFSASVLLLFTVWGMVMGQGVWLLLVWSCFNAGRERGNSTGVHWSLQYRPIHVWHSLSIWSPDVPQSYGSCRIVVGGLDFKWNPDKLISQLCLLENFPSCFVCISDLWYQWERLCYFHPMKPARKPYLWTNRSKPIFFQVLGWECGELYTAVQLC